MTDSMATGWYYLKSGGASDQQVGPLTWEELYSLCSSGSLQPDDLVWNPQLPEWLPAGQVPRLFAAQSPTMTPAPVSAPSPTTTPGRRRRSWLLPVLVPVAALIVVAGGLGSYFAFWQGDDDDGTTVASSTTVVGSATTASTVMQSTSTTAADITMMGAAEVKAPDLAKLVATVDWGEVPANQIGVVLEDGKSREDATALAQTLGGSVVGELAFINAYQIETAGSTEADLRAALDQAATTPGVTYAFPNIQTAGDTEIWGVRQSPLDDPAYGEGRDQGFQLIGAQKAWSYMRGSGLTYSDVHVGIVDDGLYRGNGEFDGDASIYFPDPNAGELSDPKKDTNKKNNTTVDNPAGSHGTMVGGIIGGDPSNGGMTGVASPVLGNQLTISMVNHQDGYYGNKQVANPDPNDPTVVRWSDGQSYSFGSLVAITNEIDAGAKVINCSWGTNMKALKEQYERLTKGEITNAEYQATFSEYQEIASAYKGFFEKMSTEHPEVLFVCSAGNDGWVMNGSIRYPSGLNLPNMVTVGNVMNDGTTADSSNRVNTTPGEEFEVTLAAPGQQVVQGVDAEGNPITNETDVGNGNKYGGGTSAAAPQVTAAAALLLALDPDLSAAEIKQILSDTARPGPAELGGKILAVDMAVLEVINQQRERRGLPAVTGEELEKGGVVDAVAISQDDANTWTVKAIVEALPSVDGAEITITATTGTKIEGETSQKITAPGEVIWERVVIPNDQAQITVTRLDSDAASVIAFEQIDLNGFWSGTFTITRFAFDEETAPTEGDEGCALALIGELLAKMQGRPFPMTMDITADEEGSGTAVMVLDMSALAAELAAEDPDLEIDASNEPQTIPFTYAGNALTFQLDQSSGGVASMTGTVSRQGEDLVIKGAMGGSGPGYSLAAVWTLTKE